MDKLNNEVDAEALLALVLGPECDTTRMGNSLKAHCPVHESGNFKSLQVDLGKRTCRCIVRSCRASHSMSLIDFYSLCRDLPAEVGAINLCRELDLPLPDGLVENLERKVFETFEAAKEEGRHEEALSQLALLATFEDHRAEVPIWKAEILELMDVGAGDTTHLWLTAADELGELGEHAGAVGVLERLIAKDPHNHALVGRLAEAQRARYPKSMTWGETYFRQAKLLVEEGNPEAALSGMREAMEVNSKSAEMRELMGNILYDLGRMDEARPEIWTAAFLYEQDGREEKSIPLLEKVIELDPEDTQSREKVAEFRIRLGDLGSYLRYMEALAETARDRNDWTNAELYARKILGRTRDNALAHEILATLHENRGENHVATRHLLAAARARHNINEKDSAQTHLDKARELGLEGTDAQTDLAETLVVMGEKTQAITILQDVVTSLLELDLIDEATPLLKRLATLAPDPTDFVARAADLTGSLDMPEMLNLWEHAALSHIEAGNKEEALSLVESGVATLGGSPGAGLLRFRVLLAAGEREPAIDALIESVEERLLGEDVDGSLELLREGIKRCPDAVVLHVRLAKLAFSSGAREESLSAWKHLLRLEGLTRDERRKYATEAVSLPGSGPVFKLLEGLAHWRNGDLKDAHVVYTNLAADLLGRATGKKGGGGRLDPHLLDEFLGFFRSLKLDKRHDLATRLASSMEEALTGSWDGLEKLCGVVAEGADKSEAIAIASRYFEESQGSGEVGDRLRVVEYILGLLPEDPKWKETHATLLSSTERKDEARQVWTTLAETLTGSERTRVAREALAHIPGDIHLKGLLLEALLDEGEAGEGCKLADELILHHRASDELDAAVHLAGRLLQVVPDRLDLRLQLAQDLLALGKPDEAATEYGKVAGQAGESNPQIARSALQAMLEIRGDDEEILSRLIQVTRRVADIREARPYRHRLYELLIASCADQTKLTPEMIDRLGEIVKGDLEDSELRDHHVTYLSSRGLNQAAAKVLLEFSRGLLEARRVEESLTALESALGHAPTSLPILAELAERREQAGKTAEAIGEWQHCLALAQEAGEMDISRQAWGRIARLNPGQPDVIRGYATFLDELGEVEEALRLYRQGADIYINDGRFEDAVPLLDRMLELDPDDLATRSHLADSLFKSGRRDEALEARLTIARAIIEQGDLAWAESVALQAFKEAPDSSEAEQLVIDVYLKAGKTSRAIEVLGILVNRLHDEGEGSKATEILQAHVSTLMEGKNYTPLLAIMESCPALIDTDAELVHAHGLALEGLGREDEAADRWRHLAELVRERGDMEQAEEHLRRSIALDPQNRDARFSLVELLEQQGEKSENLISEYHDLAGLARSEGKNEEAVELLEKILRVEPFDIVALRRLSKIHAEMDNVREALRRYNELGQAHLKLGDMEAAERAFQSASLIDPLDPAPHEGMLEASTRAGRKTEAVTHGLNLSELLFQTGEVDRFIKLLEKLSRDHPADPSVHHRIADYFESAGEMDKAIAHLRHLYSIHLGRKEFTSAIEILTRIEGIDSGDPENLAQMGRLYIEMQDKTQAADYFIMAVRNFREREQPKEALGLATEALEVLSWNEELLSLHADLATELGDKDGAAKTLEKLLELAGREQNPEKEMAVILRLVGVREKDVNLRGRLANLYSDLDYPEQASEQFLVLAELLEKQGDKAGALDAASTAGTLCPDQPAARERMGHLHGEMGNRNRAADEFLWLAGYYEKEGETARALEALEKLDDDTLTEEHLLRMALFCSELGRDEKALGIYRKLTNSSDTRVSHTALEGVLRHDITDRDSFTKLYQALRKKGRNDAAQQFSFRHFERLLEAGEVDMAREIMEAAQPHATDKFQFLRDSATLYEENGLPELAANSLRTLAETLADEKPEHALQLVERVLALKSWDATAKELKFSLLEKLHRSGELIVLGDELINIRLGKHDVKGACEVARRMIRVDDAALAPRKRLLDMLERLNETEEYIRILQGIIDLQLKKGEIEDALDNMRRLINLRPDNTNYRRRFIDTYRQVGPDTDLVPEYIRLANTLAKGNRLHEAIKIFERLLSIAPEDDKVHHEFLRFLKEASQKERVITQTHQFAGMLISKNQGRDAMKILDDIQEDCVGDPMQHLLYGRAHLVMNAKGAGVRELSRAAELYRESAQHNEEADVLGMICQQDGFNLEARTQHVEALLSAGRSEDAIEASIALASTYNQRGLPDLAMNEFRRVVTLEPNRLEAWKLLVETADEMDGGREYVEDYVEYAEILARHGDIQESVNVYRKALKIDPQNIRANRGFIIQYPKIGSQKDIVGDMINFSQLLIEMGEPDEAAKYFELVLTLDPKNTRAREILSATRGNEASAHKEGTASTGKSPSATQAIARGYLDEELGLTDTQKRFIYQSGQTGATSPLQEGEQTDGEEADTLSQAVANYRNILAVNSSNAEVRIKLAEVLEQMNRHAEVLEELRLAADAYYRKSQLEQCVAVCNRILKLDPANPVARRMLNEAEIKRDAISALDSTISFLKLEEREKLDKDSRDE